MPSLTITQVSPVINTVAVTQTISPVTLEITEQVTQHTVVVSPQNITNYYSGGGEVVAALTGVASQSTDLGTFTGNVIVDNETIKGALQDLEDGVENNEAAISTNATDISANAASINTNATGISINATDITGVSTVANANAAGLNTVQTDLTTEISNRTNADTNLQNQINTNAANITSNDTDIAGLNTSVSANTTKLAGIETNAKDDQDADEVPVSATPANYTAGAANVEAHLSGIDAALANAGSGVGATLQNALDPTELALFFTDPGTYAAGTNLETILRDILIHFQPPSITGFTADGLPNNSIEHGATDTLTAADWNVTNSNNVDSAITGSLQYVDPVGTDDETWTGVAHTASPYSINKNVTFNVSLTNVGQTTTSRGQTNTYYLRFSGLRDTQGNELSSRTDYFTVLFRTFILTSPTAIAAGAVTDQTGTDLIDDSIAGTGGATVEYNNLHADSLQQVTLTYPDTANYWYAVMPQCHWEYANKVTTDQGFAGFEITTTIVDCGAFFYNNANSQNIAMQVLRGPSIGQIGSGKYIKFEYDSGVALNTPAAPASGNRGGGSGSPALDLLLDTYTGAAAAYSVRKLDKDYTGSCMRVREDSGDTETDIGFDSSGNLDTAAIASHCGSANGYVVTWYDQANVGGTANNATQSTTANQPQIYNGTAVITDNSKPALELAGDYLATTSSNLTLSDGGYCTVGVAQYDSTVTSAPRMIAASDVVGTARIGQFLRFRQFTNALQSIGFTTGASVAQASAGSSPSGDTQLLAVAEATGTNLTVYLNGTGGTAVSHTNTTATGIFAVGANNGSGQSPFYGKIQEVIHWPDDQSSNRTGIESDINSEYLIYQPTDQPTSGLLYDYGSQSGGTDAAAAYSVRQLSNKAVICMRIRRDMGVGNPGHDDETNIGFDANGDLDTQAISDFCGTGTGYVTRWWDQSVNGNHADQTVPGNQPQIYNGTAVTTENSKPILSGGSLSFSAITITNSLHSLFSVIYYTANAIYGSNASSSSYQLVHRSNTTFQRIGGLSTFNPLPETTSFNAQQVVAVVDDATTLTSSVNGTAGTKISAGSYTKDINLTHRGEFGLSSGVKLQELIIYLSDQSSNRTDIEDDINSEYLIYQPTDTPTSGLLATYSGAAAAYSVRQLANTALIAMTVRRDSDDEEQNFGFDSNGDLDTAGIASFCGSANGYVSQWWDQSTNGNHASQGTFGSQPQIYDGTAVITKNGEPGLDFGTSTSTVLSAGNIWQSGTSTKTGVQVVNINTINTLSFRGRFVQLENQTFNYHQNGLFYFLDSSQFSKTGAVIDTDFLLTWQNHFDDAGTTKQRGSVNAGGYSSVNTSGRSHNLLNIGASSNAADALIKELIIWENQESNENVAGIQTNINGYYNIYS